jgi:uncharacterized protein (DUF58 family)
MNNHSRPVFFLVYLLLFVGLVAREGALLALAIPLVLYLGVGLYFAPRKPALGAERTLSADRVSQDDPVVVCLKITNLGAPIESLQVEESLPADLKIVDGSNRLITSLNKGKTAELKYTLRGKRGYYHLPGFRITVRDHLGILQKEAFQPHSSRFVVVPQAYKLPEVAIRPRNTRVFPGLIPARKGGPGVEFYGVREYQWGDPRRWINNRMIARHQETIFVNEFEQERAVDVGMILDCRIETNLFRGNAEMLEHGTRAAATLAESFLSYGNRVGLLIYGGGRIWVHPGYGKMQRERIMQALAGVELHDRVIDKELDNLPTRLFPARSQLVLISSLLFKDLSTLVSLRAHGYPLFVISPDPIEFERKLLGDSRLVAQATRYARLERDYFLRELRRAGAGVFEWRVEEPFHLAAHYALSRAASWHRTRRALNV